MTWPTEELTVSRSGTDWRTTTSAVTVPGRSVTSSRSRWFTSTRTSTSVLAKPGIAAVSRYSPGWSPASSKVPSSPLAVVRETPRLASRTATVTPGIASPWSSRTRPVIVAVVFCARAGSVAASTIQSTPTEIDNRREERCWVSDMVPPAVPTGSDDVVGLRAGA